MKKIRAIPRYIKLLALFIKFALQTEMEYKINFFAGILVECGYFLVKLAYVYIVFQTGNTDLRGLAPEDVSIYVGTFTIITAFFMFFWPSFLRLSTVIRDGSLDILLTKPVDLQFIMSLRYLSCSMILPNLIGGSALLCYGLHRSVQVMEWWSMLGYLFFVILGTVLIYSLFLIPKAFLSFWFVSSSSADIFISSIWDANNMPMSIYGKMVRIIGTYVVPVFIIANYPAMFITHKLHTGEMIWAMVAVTICFCAARWIFNMGIRHYESASS
ncbi:MAG: ABC-2 family transporter protein [Acetatifactor sp.]|nr:ABC-2 family transporter protein [Acetatifactor sp.]